MPVLVPPTARVEYALEPHQHAVDVQVPHVLFVNDASILQADQSQVCLRLYTPEEEEREEREGGGEGESLPAAGPCISVYARHPLQAGQLGEGEHPFELTLRDGQHPVPASKVHMSSCYVIIVCYA